MDLQDEHFVKKDEDYGDGGMPKAFLQRTLVFQMMSLVGNATKEALDEDCKKKSS